MIDLSGNSQLLEDESVAYLGYYGLATTNLRGNSQFVVSNGVLGVGYQNTSQSVLNIQDSATLSFSTVYVGSSGSARGCINQTGGTVQGVAETTTSTNMFVIGGYQAAGSNSYGCYNLSGASSVLKMTSNKLYIGYYGTGVFNQSGGNVNYQSSLVSGANSDAIYVGFQGNSYGLLNVTGGTFSATNTQYNVGIAVGSSAGVSSYACLNVNGTGFVNSTKQLNLNSPGIINIGTGGLLQTGLITGNGGASLVDFHGGTLRSDGSQATLLSGVAHAYIYSEGARSIRTAIRSP